MADTFTRVARAIAVAHARSISPAQAAEQLHRHDKYLAHVLTKAGVDPLDRTSELYSPQKVMVDHVEAVRPLTVLGKLLPFARRVPFATPLAYLTAGTTMQFIGETLPISVQAPTFGTNITLPRLKLAGIVVMSVELLESSQGEEILGADMRRAEIEASDRLMLDPTLAPIDRTQPASLTYQMPEVDATGVADAGDVDGVLADLLASLVAAGSNLAAVHFITTTTNCVSLSMMRDTLGARAFPTVTAVGGTIAGLPLIASASAPADTIIAIDASEMLVADDSQAEVTASKFALIDMDTAPAGSNRVSMFQSESAAIKLLRWVNWSMRREFVAYATSFAPPLPTAGGAS